MHSRIAFLRYRQLIPREDGRVVRAARDRGDDADVYRLDGRTHTRIDVWPGAEHAGCRWCCPGVRWDGCCAFEHAPDGSTWRYQLEFRGAREG